MSSAPGLTAEPELYIGLMSGTSMDGVDAVLVSFPPATTNTPPTPLPLKALAHTHLAYPGEMVDELLALNQVGPNELHRAALAANAVAEIYARAVAQLLQVAKVAASQITAIAAHGQTVRHQPRLDDGSVGYTLQLNQPALLAERCGIDVVADFRSRDVAAGGQGAPLVPAFHHAVFAQLGSNRAVLNIGGISNLSLLAGDGNCLGLDCGPGNVLMDLWCKQHTGAAYDDGGRWAASGQVVAPLLDTLLAEPYFAKPAPKSTGRDLFNAGWLSNKLKSLQLSHEPAAADVQATLLALTAQTIANDLRRYMKQVQAVFVCGGGAYNDALMAALTQALPGVAIHTTADLGLPPEQVEAAAFAWLAWAHKHRVAGNVPAVTGASGSRILGALYPTA
ncbi:MAG: anhydro-N-acetylmuramic acid kinase [Burkholderiales bacterium]